jgi:hypothetical protein
MGADSNGASYWRMGSAPVPDIWCPVCKAYGWHLCRLETLDEMLQHTAQERQRDARR